MSQAVSLFYSYAHEDEPLRDELQGHLKILERRGLIRAWHDRQIQPGQDWAGQIDQHLNSADLVLLLLSVDFVNSDYIWGTELKAAMQRQAAGDATVVPIVLRPMDLQAEDWADLPFGNVMATQGLPRDLKPVTTWANRDEAWAAVARGLRGTVNAIRERRAAVVSFAAPPGEAQVQPVKVPSAPRSGGVASWFKDLLHPSPRPAPPAEPAPDALLQRVVQGVVAPLAQAQAARGGTVDTQALEAQALKLVDTVDAKRVLWVDDHPENNTGEAAALARLQIEVVQVLSTAAALAALQQAQGAEAFDLVISDWTRDAEPPAAGLALLKAMRERGFTQPLVLYHGRLRGPQRAQVAAAAAAAGALGEAVLPAELMTLVLKGLSTPHP